MATERVQLRKPDYIDLTRHVRTEAGVRYYHKPIGTPLGGGSAGHKVSSRTAKRVEQSRGSFPLSGAGSRASTGGTDPAKVQAVDAFASRVAKQTVKVDASPVERAGLVPSVRHVGGTTPRPRANTFKSRDTVPRVKLDEEHAKVAGVPSDFKTNDNLWQLDNKRLKDAIDKSTADPKRQKELKIELAKRQAAIKGILAEHAAGKKVFDEDGHLLATQPGKFFQRLYKVAPSIKPKMEKVRNSGASRKLRSVKYTEILFEAFAEKAAEAAIGIALIKLGLGGA